MKVLCMDGHDEILTEGHTSKGNQPKWHLRSKWYKADHMGYETLAEVLISTLLQKSNAGNVVQYSPVLIQYQGRDIPGCESVSFQKKDEMLVPFERLHRSYEGVGLAQALAGMDTVEERIAYTVSFIETHTGLTDIGPHLTLLLELDAFFLNEDRHTNNLAVIRNEKSLQYRLCPIFDNGLSLLSDTNDYPLDADIYDCIQRVKAKPFDANFYEQLSAAEKLYGPQLRFCWTRTDAEAALDKLRALYDETTIRRVSDLLWEQMRRYPIFWN